MDFISAIVGEGRTELLRPCGLDLLDGFWGEAEHEYGNLYRQLGLGTDLFWGAATGRFRPAGRAGAASNHIGIFLGMDEDGKVLWVHCSGSGTQKDILSKYATRCIIKVVVGELCHLPKRVVVSISGLT